MFAPDLETGPLSRLDNPIISNSFDRSNIQNSSLKVKKTIEFK